MYQFQNFDDSSLLFNLVVGFIADFFQEPCLRLGQWTGMTMITLARLLMDARLIVDPKVK
jgi:hypothetical protein